MINIAICDDEELYQEIICYKISQCMQNIFDMDFKLFCFNNLYDLKKHIDNNKTDIIFLDIMVNDENAMDWSIKNIPSKYTQIVFMTSFPQSAYNISETNCCYFLIKSRIDESTLTKALKRALQKTTKKDPNLTIIKSGSKNSIINFQDIIYLETFNNNLMIHVKSLGNILIYSSLKEYQKTLPPNFLRCHKSFMVNMNHISSYEPYKFITASGSEIPIPPKKYNSVISIYKNYLKNL